MSGKSPCCGTAVPERRGCSIHPGPRPPDAIRTSHGVCVEGSAEAGQTRDTSRHCPVQGASPSRLAGSHEPTLALGGFERCGTAGPAASRVGGCQGTPRPCPRGGAHLCRRHTRSGRCGHTPSGSSPRWLPLAGSSSTSLKAPGNSEQGRRNVERQRRPRQSPARERSTPTAPAAKGTRRRSRASPAPRCLPPRAAPFLPVPGHGGRRRASRLAVCRHARGFSPLYRSPGWHRSQPPRGRGLGCAVARWQRWQRWQRTPVVPISCPVPSGCCRDGSTQPRGTGRERAAASAQPRHEHARLGMALDAASPKPGIGGGGTLAGDPCPASAGWLSPPSPQHNTPVSPWWYPSSVLPISLARCARAPLALGEGQGRAAPSLQLPITVASGHLAPIFVSHPASTRLRLSRSEPAPATHSWAGGCIPMVLGGGGKGGGACHPPKT